MAFVCGKKPSRQEVMRYTIYMKKQALFALVLLAFLMPENSLAQSFLVPQTAPTLLQGEVDIYVEADTYVPYFYKGRAEISSGNGMSLIAIPVGLEAGEGVTYYWSINGKAVPGSTSRINLTTPIGSSFTVKVSVIKNGTLWAERSEVIKVSSPVVLFYENNALRGLGAIAIGSSYQLIGDEANILAEPFFVGKTTVGNLLGTWKVNGRAVNVPDWRNMTLERTEETLDRYTIELELDNPKNLGESAKNSFYLDLSV